MDRFRILGGKALKGNVSIQGAKNAALPEMAASILSSEPVTLLNIPDLQDIRSMTLLLVHLGVNIRRDGNTLELDASRLNSDEAPYDLVRKMRASILVLGPLLTRAGHAKVSLPGGCAIGARPVDLHLKAMKALGASIELDHGYIVASAKKSLSGGEYTFGKVTVTGTENALMAAALAKGKTVLHNCATEPEVVDLGRMLLAMGAEINGLGYSTITVEGVEKLGGCRHSIIPDRIEAGTYITAGIITNSNIRVENCRPQQLQATIDKILEIGGSLEIGEDYVLTKEGDPFTAIDVQTAPYPGFATDMQAQFMVLMTQAKGLSTIKESIFENRFMHVPELNRMGAGIRIAGSAAEINGISELTGANVMATDLRASASLVLAGLVANGETIINRVYHIDRGYNHIVTNLTNLGADIERLSD